MKHDRNLSDFYNVDRKEYRIALTVLKGAGQNINLASRKMTKVSDGPTENILGSTVLFNYVPIDIKAVHLSVLT